MKNSELKGYLCHRLVRAGEILQIDRLPRSGAILRVRGETGKRMEQAVPHAFLVQHKPHIGGYYVIGQDDGIAGFLSAAQFESTHMSHEKFADRVTSSRELRAFIQREMAEIALKFGTATEFEQ